MRRFVPKFSAQMMIRKKRRLLLSKPEVEQIRESCLRLLVRREHSQLELQNKLVAKGFPAERVKDIIDELRREGWQCNKRFAESYIRNRINRGYGPVKIGYELRQRGIEKVEQDPIVAELAGSWEELIEQVYLRKYTDAGKLASNEWAKRTRYLKQRGFTNAMIRSLFDHLDISLS